MKTILKIMIGAMLSLFLYGNLFAQNTSPNGEFSFEYLDRNTVVTSLNDTIDVGPNNVLISDEGHIFFFKGNRTNTIPVYVSKPFLMDDLYTTYAFVQYEGDKSVQMIYITDMTIAYTKGKHTVEGYRDTNDWLDLWEK